MINILYLFLIFFISGCDLPDIETPYHPTRLSLVNEVRNKTFVQLKTEKGLYPCGIANCGIDKIKMLDMAFHYYKEVDIDEARKLLMAAGTLFLKNINSNEKLQSYLQNSPFKPENICIEIYLQNSDGSEFGSDKLSVITMTDGILSYKLNTETRLITIYRENFEEATVKLGITVDF
jgi:hypothetical protein